jgi:hypothetical protein
MSSESVSVSVAEAPQLLMAMWLYFAEGWGSALDNLGRLHER